MINDYVIQPETLGGGMQTMGVFAHEYGHAIGLPDLYDTDGSSEGIGDWSLMAGGSWNYVTRSGDRPAHMDAWCKYKLGWVMPTRVTGTLMNEPITQAATAADVYQLGNGSPVLLGGEYFLVENRQKAGFDAGLPGAGLLIWHIDESMTTNNSECYPGGPDCSIQHYHVALEQADNLWELGKNIDRGDTGDPYPGSTGNTSFTGSSSPNSNLYNGNPSNASVTNISTPGYTMTATLIALEPNISASPNSYYFGSVYVGKTSINAFTISNTGTTNLVIGTIEITDTDASEFSILNDTCSGQTIASSGTCRVNVRFSPASGIPDRFSMAEYFKQAMSLLTPTGYKQTKSTILNIPSNDPDTPTLEAPLKGKGYATMMQRILDIQKVWQRLLFPSGGR